MNMKNVLFGLIAFISFSACGTMSNDSADKVNQNAESPAPPQDQIAVNVDVEEFQSLIAKKQGVVLDVRTPQEYNAGHLTDCTHMDFYSSDFSQQLDQLDKNKPVYVYCKVGGRSGKTMSMLKDKGFAEVYNLDGGYDAWSKAKMPVEK